MLRLTTSYLAGFRPVPACIAPDPARSRVKPAIVRLASISIIAVALTVLTGQPRLLANEVGKASAVNPAATANLRTISIGSSIAHKERVKTTAAGSVQILFVDKTSMTVGPNSDLTIDEYVYDPNASTGKLAATLGKGALRFVGGQISHSGDAEIKTANAVIGIRGGVALITSDNVFAGYGTSTVTSGGSTVRLGVGEFTHTNAGSPPTTPTAPPPNFVANLIRTFQSTGGQTGGAPKGTASPVNVARAESRATGTPAGAVAGQLTPPPPAPVIPVTLAATTSNNLTQTVQTSSQNTAVQTTVQEMRPTTLTGFFSGLDRWLFGSNVFMTTIKGDTEITLDPAQRRVQAELSNFELDVFNPRRKDATARMGSLDPSQPGNSTYVDAENFSANGQGNATGIPFNSSLTTVTRDSARQIATAMGAPNLTICDCDYTRWGTWEAQALYNYDDAEQERLFGFWVAGRQTTIAEVPTTGRATYIGHVAAYVQDVALNTNGNAAVIGDYRLVGGNFTNTVDFGARTGDVTVTGLDRTNYSGTVYFQSDPRRFNGTLYGDYGNRLMGLTGNFFRGTTSPVGEMGGSVTISGTNYVGGGIFAARMK